MKRLRLIVMASIVLLASPAAARGTYLRITPDASQPSRMEDGRRHTDDIGNAATVRFVAPKPANSKRAAFAIFVLNKSDRGIDVGPEAVSATLDDGTQVKILTYADMMREQRRREWWQNFGQAMSAMGAANAGYRSGTATYSGYGHGSIGTTPYNSYATGTVTYQGYDPTAQAAAMAENRRRANELALNQAAARAGIESFLQTTTVDPGQVYGGLIAFDIPRSARGKKVVPVTFIVNAGGEAHRFRGYFEPE